MIYKIYFYMGVTQVYYKRWSSGVL